MGGKNSGPGTEAKDGLGKGKEYKNPEYFNNEHYSFYDQEKELVDSEKRLEQPQSGLSDYWSKIQMKSMLLLEYCFVYLLDYFVRVEN